MAKQILPPTPFDGQLFIDAFRVEWVYNAENETWTKIGVASDVPIARSDDNELGPTNGLFSARDKQMLDNTKDKAGGFGFILKPGYYLTEDNGADNIISGDVQFVSETLQFECTTSTQTGVCEGGFSLPTVKIGLSNDFLEAYRLEIQGPKGKAGKAGLTGLGGRPGTGNGPVGDTGANGTDATAHTFSGILYEELDEIYDTAVVNLRLDAPNGVLEVTKAQMDVPGNDKAATRVAATPVIRDVEFTSADMSEWQIVAPSDDPASTTDLNIIKLPKGWTGDSDSPVPVAALKFSLLVDNIVEYYDVEATKIIEQWDQLLKEWVIGRDTAAREALHTLATQLAECEFQLPLEFCLGIEACTPGGGGTLGNVVMIVFIDEASPIYYASGNTAYDADLAAFQNSINQKTGSVFSSFSTNVWRPPNPAIPTYDVKPKGTTAAGYTITDIDRPPAVEDLAALYTSLTSGTQVDNIYLLVDRSGSMQGGNAIEPGYGEFVQWLAVNTTANVVEAGFTTERWLEYLTSYVASLA